MQTSLSLRRIFSRSLRCSASRALDPLEGAHTVETGHSTSNGRKYTNPQTGFTLIELLICAAIITVITSIVLVRFNAFDGTVLLKSLAYEVAMSVREAQIYSLSVMNTGGGNFRYPYGLSFSPGNTSYLFFRFADTSARPYNDIAETDPDVTEVIRTLTLNNAMETYRVCIKRTSIAEDCRTSGGILDISFRRPEFSAIFNASWLATNQQASIEYARIELRSTRNSTNVWAVEVRLLGQISVFKCSATTCP